MLHMEALPASWASRHLALGRLETNFPPGTDHVSHPGPAPGSPPGKGREGASPSMSHHFDFTSRHFTSLHLVSSLSLHFTGLASLHFASLHITSLHLTPLTRRQVGGFHEILSWNQLVSEEPTCRRRNIVRRRESLGVEQFLIK